VTFVAFAECRMRAVARVAKCPVMTVHSFGGNVVMYFTCTVCLNG